MPASSSSFSSSKPPTPTILASLAACVLGAAAWFGAAPIITTGMGIITAITIGYAIYEKASYNKLLKFFDAAKLRTERQAPVIIEKRNLDNGTLFKIKMPCGMDIEQFEKARPALEKWMHADCCYEWKDCLWLTVYKGVLERLYKYEIIRRPKPLEICIGYTRGGPLFLDLEECPHVLFSGATGSGKSVAQRSIITSLILTKDCIIHLVDFAKVELGIFKRSSRISSFCSTPGELGELLNKIKAESERRLDWLEAHGKVNIQGTNFKRIVVVIDEFAALGKEKIIMEMLRQRFAMDRKVGVSYIVCTQHPTREVIDSVIKANIPVRVAFQTAMEANSRIIIDQGGAEKLRGSGHGLLKQGANLTEFQGLYLGEDEAVELVRHTFVEKPKAQEPENIMRGKRVKHG